MIRAKMLCTGVTSSTTDGKPESPKASEAVYLSAVGGKDGTANAAWSKFTPSGSVTMSINNPEAFDRFKVGSFYFVDFSETTEESR